MPLALLKNKTTSPPPPPPPPPAGGGGGAGVRGKDKKGNSYTMNLSQIVISSRIKHAPNVSAFTEQGVAMLSSVLNSLRAVHVNIEIMKAFVRLFF